MASWSDGCEVERATACYQTDKELAAILAPAGQLRRLEAGATLFSVGAPATGMYLILKGTAQARLTVESHEVMCRVAGASAILGLSSAMCSGHYKFDARALEPLEAVLLETASVNQILRGNPELGLRLMNLMCDEMDALRQTRDHMRNCQRPSCGLFEACSRASLANG